MQYPLISEYVRAIQDAGNNLDKLAHLVPVLDAHGEPYRSSGAFAVVFKMKDERTGKCYALKCFTEEQEGRAEAYRKIAEELECVDSFYVTSVKYLEKEIFVDSSCEEDEFPVLLMDWIDGETMENYIAENYQDNYIIAMLCYRFCKMAAWLRSQPFAHGDIKPDNIMVRHDGNLTLVDYDGMFVPAMKGQKSPTVGTKDFSHPQRTVDDFDETIDDFALASIALSLKAISLKPSLLDEYGAADRLLFSAENYRNPSNSKIISALQELMCDNDFCNLYSLFFSALARKQLSLCSFRLFLVEKPGLPPIVEKLSTEVIAEELEYAFVDKWGVKYSKDGRRLLRAPKELKGVYYIKRGVKVICDNAFACTSLTSIVIPNGVTSIGDYAFYRCGSLSSIVIPDSVTSIGDRVFEDCRSLSSVVIPNGVTSIGDYAFGICRSLTGIVIPNGVTSIGDYAFYRCSSLSSIVIPDSVTSIGDSAFSLCRSLTNIVIPNSVTSIEGNPFVNWAGILKCQSSYFVYEDGVLFDSERRKIIAFRKDIKSYTIPRSVASIGYHAFLNCRSLVDIIIPNNVVGIGKRAFWGCDSLASIIIPDSVTSIGDSAFWCCRSLSNIVILNSITSIGKGAFYGCSKLTEKQKIGIIRRFGKEVFE